MKENPLAYSDDKAYRIAYLIAGYIRKTLTEAEHDELDAWVEASDENMLLFEELTDERNIEANLAWMQGIQTEKALEKVKKQLQFSPASKTKKRRSWPFIAAAVMVIAVVTIYFVRTGKTSDSRIPVEIAKSDALPGGNKATLTLGDGSVIDLQARNTGIIQNGTGTKIEKTGEGQLMYEKQNETKESTFNVVAIPKGGQYSLTLADGTKVWLNALSSLKFPEQFNDSLRIVELTGEGFFEVAKDKQHPFIVKMDGGEQVRVLGTQFNINSYKDENAKRVTLIEGSIDVTLRQTQGDKSIAITPGQQVQIRNGNLSVEKNADTDEAIGWRKGNFVFRDADVYAIMRQAERWYDVNVIYKTTTSEHFNFSISRNEPLSRILHLMELTGKIHFKIENKSVYVLP